MKLTAADRSSLPSSTFGLPGGRFPMPDSSHTRAALSGASRALNVGNITAAQKEKIDAKAHGIIGRLKKT